MNPEDRMDRQDRMDHAAAHERIEDLLLEPARLHALDVSRAPEDVALREHLAGCPTCAGDLEAWGRLQRAMGDALPGDAAAAAAAVEPIEVPPSLRARTLAATRSADQPGAPIQMDSSRRGRRLGAWLGLAASFAILAGAGFLAVDQMDRRAAAEAETRELAAVVAVVDRMLATNHKIVELRTASGQSAGTISWSRHDWVVLTGALAAPPAGQEYLCWLETDGRSVPIGHMEFAGSTAYWVASLDEWQTWEMGPTTRFVVTLEPVGAEQRTGPAILEAALAS
jgi:hypothetical protein